MSVVYALAWRDMFLIITWNKRKRHVLVVHVDKENVEIIILELIHFRGATARRGS